MYINSRPKLLAARCSLPLPYHVGLKRTVAKGDDCEVCSKRRAPWCSWSVTMVFSIYHHHISNGHWHTPTSRAQSPLFVELLC